MTSIAVQQAKNATEKAPPLFRDLRLSAEQADKEMLVASLMRLVDIHPHTYLLASCGVRAGSAAAQTMLDDAEDILKLMMTLNNDHARDWSPLTLKLQAFFDPIAIESPDFLPLLEYALGRIILFSNLFGRSDELAPAFAYLVARHLVAIKQQPPKTNYLGELLANWLEHSSSPLLLKALPQYLSTISEDEVHAFRDQISQAWMRAYIEEDEYAADSSDKLFPPLQEAAKLVGIPDFLRTFILTGLDTSNEYLEAVWRLFELQQIDDAHKLANQCLEKFGEEVCEDLVDVFVEAKTNAGDHEGAANEYLRMMEIAPTPLLVRSFADYVEDHSKKLPESELLDRGQQIIRARAEAAKGSAKTALSTTLVSYCHRRGKIEEALACLQVGSDPGILTSLLKADEGRKFSFGQILPLVRPQLEVELARESRDLDTAQELLLMLYRVADSAAEKAEFKTFAKALREQYDLKGKSAQILRRVGL